VSEREVTTEALDALSEILKITLTSTVHENSDTEVIVEILRVSEVIYCTSPKIFLYEKLKEHGIWEDEGRWVLWI
jgi:hypothetical protein